MQAMLDGLTDRLIGGPPILTASVSTNLTESKLAEGMSKIQDKCTEVSIGSYPYFKRGKLGVNIVLRSIDKTLLLKQLALITTLVERNERHYSGDNNARLVGARLLHGFRVR